MGTVAALYRYPVKSMAGEPVIAVTVTERGLCGDRVYAVLDGTGAVGSAKHPRKWGELLRCRSRLDDLGMVRVVLPDGTAHPAEDPDLDGELSKLLGRNVFLSATVPEHGRLERAVPAYEGGVPDSVRESATVDVTGETITTGGVAPGTFFDFGRVHLVTTAALDRMRAVHPAGDFDARRFRPNLVVDTPGGAGFPEDAWVGSYLRAGEALFRVLVPTPRCVVPALGHGELPPDPGIMRAVAREHRVPVFDLGRLSCLGVYLDVLEAGTVRVGDPISLQNAA
ncbi:MOSC domain-containing protein [Streptomyces hokutonensis]|uniref:MOSC domain-containing protein n=1 Tax=Streptomyces hokutonensis TaxID=1306990 RepID=A0ABW6MDP8_9ACTN